MCTGIPKTETTHIATQSRSYKQAKRVDLFTHIFENKSTHLFTDKSLGAIGVYSNNDNILNHTSI